MATSNSISPQRSSQAPSRPAKSRLKPIHVKFTAASVRVMLEGYGFTHSHATMAREIGVTREQLSEVLSGRRPTARMARFFGLARDFSITYTD